jgi:hypothetical protein
MSDNLGTAFNPKNQALYSRSEEVREKKSWAGKAKTCWQCQKDKSPAGGHVKAMPGFYKFVCKDCCEANTKKRLED